MDNLIHDHNEDTLNRYLESFLTLYMIYIQIFSPDYLGIHRFDLFPEGGQLIDGINTIVAFKATYGKGFPEDISGKVMEDDREITAIRSLHDGMGMFAITPRWGKDYKVILSDGRTYPLPAIERTGMGLRVLRNNESGITIVVSASDTIARPFTILAKIRGMLCCTAKGVVKGQQIVRMPKERFPMQGIAEITLTVGDNLFPVAERLVYVNPIQRLNITAQTDHQQYNSVMRERSACE